MLRILLIEDEFIIVKDIKILLSQNKFALVDNARNYDAALDLFSKYSYDLIISDINLNDEKDGIEIITELSKIKEIPVVYLTAYSNSDIVKRAEETMPFAYIIKPYNDNQLKVTLNLAIINFNKRKDSVQENLQNTSKLHLLTCREKEVLVTLSSGKISKEIAEILNISKHTVEQHKKNIKKKLNLSTIGELVNFTMSTKLLEVCEHGIV